MAGSDRRAAVTPAAPRRRGRGTLALAAAALAVANAPALARPERVVSLHLCADQLLLGLADRSQVVSLSPFATDPLRSHMAAAAAGIPRSRGTAEEVLGMTPDLVLAGARSARSTVATLSRLGIRVMDLPLPRDFAAIRDQIRAVAAALGHAARGEAMIAAMDARLAAARHDVPRPRPVAFIWQPGGFTSGPGSLEHAVLAAAGFDNLAARFGIGPFGHLPLERLVRAVPDLVINWMGSEPFPSLAREGLHHPALLKAARGTPVLSMPPELWTCGAWFTAGAVERLAAVRRALGKRRAAAERGRP